MVQKRFYTGNIGEPGGEEGKDHTQEATCRNIPGLNSSRTGNYSVKDLPVCHVEFRDYISL